MGEHLHLEPTLFFWLFRLAISGIMAASFAFARLTGKDPAEAANRPWLMVAGR